MMERKKEDKRAITLKYPIPIPKEGGGVVMTNTLEIGRFKTKHLRVLPKGFFESEGKIEPVDVIPIISGIADIPESSADEIDLEDLITVARELEAFFQSVLSPAIGENSSGG